GVSHELRTPLNTLYGYAQLLEQNQEFPETLLPQIKTISQNAEHITCIIEGLLEISKIEAKQVDVIHKAPFSIPDFLDSLIDMFAPKAAASQIHFIIDFQTPMPNFAITDVKRLKQILTNLLSNAIKYTPKGSVTFGFSYKNQVAHFSIKDTGVGINPNDQDRIFEPFERLKVTPSSGTGLGLSIARLMAQLLGGDIWLESREGLGSTFYFSVFLPSHSLPVEAQIPKKNTLVKPNLSLLLVDDEKDHLSLLTEYFTPLGYSITTASSAEKAIELLSEHHFDACILDIRLPKMNGWQLAEKLKAQSSPPFVVILSGDAIEHHQQALNAHWHDAYLTKPVNFIALQNILNQSFIASPSPKQIAHNLNLTPSQWLNSLTQATKIGHLSAIDALLENPPKCFMKGHFLSNLYDQRQQLNYESILTLIEEQRE
ncbi:MAG: ATP-binding protein, partial [Cellvibrionales bacterium]|nr:ATP-binding protein [Cellvibrionales bacterium]